MVVDNDRLISWCMKGMCVFVCVCALVCVF